LAIFSTLLGLQNFQLQNIFFRMPYRKNVLNQAAFHSGTTEYKKTKKKKKTQTKKLTEIQTCCSVWSTIFMLTQLPIQQVLGALSPRVKWPGRKVDHSPPASAEVKKTYTYTSTPPYVFMV
jgi:hypothetical protein